MISAEVSSASGVFSATMKDAMRLKLSACAVPAANASADVSVTNLDVMKEFPLGSLWWGLDQGRR